MALTVNQSIPFQHKIAINCTTSTFHLLTSKSTVVKFHEICKLNPEFLDQKLNFGQNDDRLNSIVASIQRKAGNNNFNSCACRNSENSPDKAISTMSYNKAILQHDFIGEMTNVLHDKMVNSKNNNI